jgi:BirA family biotin operon repressor/biotin-[acetyl-CoA-carboxylase] ligase
MHNAIERDTRLDVDIKWPNDLLVGGKKVCGILAEIQAEVDLVKTLIVGVGLNVNHRQFPPEIAERATSLRLASGRIQSRLEIFAEFLEDFEGFYGRFEKSGPAEIIAQWTKCSSFAEGRRIEINDGVRLIRGVTRGLNPLGALRVEDKSGRTEEVYSGDVVAWE